MKARETIILWNTNSGDVKVGPVNEPWIREYKHYRKSGGAAWASTKKEIPGNLDSVEKADVYHAMQLYRDFVQMVVGDNVDPQAIYDEFIKIDEFERFLSLDMPGVECRECGRSTDI